MKLIPALIVTMAQTWAMLSEVSLVMFIGTLTRLLMNKPPSFEDWDASEAYK
tara:strand:- start:940 stop:1095 length:156 start_codon:yes stop_codon:yes gene_type:complete